MWSVFTDPVTYVSKMEIRPFEDSKIKIIDRKWRVFVREVKAGVERVKVCEEGVKFVKVSGPD